jgi:phosphoglycerate dehydrogenase-like enzyme
MGDAGGVVARVRRIADSPLWDAPNLHLSPHSSASLDHYVESVFDLFADNLGRYLRREPLRNVVPQIPSFTPAPARSIPLPRSLPSRRREM